MADEMTTTNTCPHCGQDMPEDAIGPTIVGNLADLQRLGAAEVASGTKKNEEVFRLPAGMDQKDAKVAAQRALDEEAEAKAEPTSVEPPKEDKKDKDPAELKRK